MKKTLSTLLALGAAGLAAWSLYLLASAPAEPAADWRAHMSDQQHALLTAPIDHAYRVAAYFITWAIQLGYVAWMWRRWQQQQEAKDFAA